MRRLLLVLPLVVALPGCSGGGSESKPVTLPPLTAAPSTSATPSPSVAPVKKPAEADEPSREGAEAFALHWIAALNQAYDTLDPGPLEHISAPSCRTCRNYAASLRASAAAGERYEGGRHTVKQVDVAPTLGRSARVLLDYEATKLTVIGPSGEVVDTVSADRDATLVFDLERFRKSWRAAEVARYEPS